MSLALSELPHKWVDIFLVKQKSYFQSHTYHQITSYRGVCLLDLYSFL